jgi:hypothetical protein
MPQCKYCRGPLSQPIQPDECDPFRFLLHCTRPDCGRWYFHFAGALADETRDGRPRRAYTEDLPVPSLASLGIPSAAQRDGELISAATLATGAGPSGASSG